MSLLLSKSEQGVVVFHIWKNLSYSLRILISMSLILVGLFLQYQTMQVIPWILFVLAGNMLLLVKGYDNRIKLGTYNADSEWVTSDREHLTKLVELNAKVKRWDVSALDITSGLGFFAFLGIIGLVIILFATDAFILVSTSVMLVLNLAALVLPHWFTGIKRITTLPNIVNKAKLFLSISDDFHAHLVNDSVSFLMLLRGKDQKLPLDVKMKIKFRDQPQDFLGFYAQIALNNVQGQDYPYFYVVLVSKQSAELIKRKEQIVHLPENVISEYSCQDGNEILVIRQYTTNKSGYFTDNNAVAKIFKAGLDAYQLL
jgi:hypothetical protein